ncbi:leucine-rich repeat neuronal protein 3-like [Ceratina calcarata]|uniref:Leucine-rich repeat neuronal protein 3-like n=1 Tax=Ceratina calcarata TaxID=156304 RepID=A0AAJ7S9B3_9HYME|nr:leucine-rich repeat neuronal protein 3-like [Ceratina calcarata]
MSTVIGKYRNMITNIKAFPPVTYLMNKYVGVTIDSHVVNRRIKTTCEDLYYNHNVTETNATDTKNVETSKTNKTEEVVKPNLYTVCNFTGDIIDCDNKNLTNHFEDSQWPNKSMPIMLFKNNSLVHVKAFPKVGIKKLILQHNEITSIDDRAFKQIINLTELDLSYNYLTGEALRPSVFEGKFSPFAYEPLEKLVTLNMAHNKLHWLNQDIFEHMSSLKILNLSGNPLTNIDARTTIALSSLSQLEELDLSYCNLTTLPEHLFRTAIHLKKLNISGNKFFIPPASLNEALTLEVLYMDENPIQIINSHQSFPIMPKLKELSLCCMPHLTVVGAGSFSGLTGLEHLRIQNCPKLESINEYALPSENNSQPVWPPLKRLDLSDNALRYLPQRFVEKWDLLEELDLMNNKWSCDCDNQYLIGTLLPKYGRKLMKDEVDSLVCASPPEHEGRNLTSLSHRTLRCLDLYGARPERDATILIGVLIGLLLAIPVCLTVFVFWRRGFFFCGRQSPATFSRAFYNRARTDYDEFA